MWHWIKTTFVVNSDMIFVISSTQAIYKCTMLIFDNNLTNGAVRLPLKLGQWPCMHPRPEPKMWIQNKLVTDTYICAIKTKMCSAINHNDGDLPTSCLVEILRENQSCVTAPYQPRSSSLHTHGFLNYLKHEIERADIFANVKTKKMIVLAGLSMTSLRSAHTHGIQVKTRRGPEAKTSFFFFNF